MLNNYTMKRVSFYGLACTFTLLLTTNTLLADETNPKSLETRKTILNAIHSDEVRDIMRRLKALSNEREYTELELQKLSNKQIELLVEEATTLVKTATNQSKIASLEKLNEEDQLTFNAMANQLRDSALELKRASDANHQSEIDAAYIKLQSTCNTCHQLFRER